MAGTATYGNVVALSNPPEATEEDSGSAERVLARPKAPSNINTDDERVSKRNPKFDDYDDDYAPNKRPKVAVDSVDAADLAGNVFLKVETPSGGPCLLTFESDLSRPLFFEERDNGAVEVPAADIVPTSGALDLRMPGMEVEATGGSRRTATVGELITYLKYVYTNGEEAGSALLRGSAPPVVYVLVRCDETPAWLTFDRDTLKAKVVVAKGGRSVEVTPQQFELEAGCHARKWRNSFKVQAALKVIRQGILTPAPYVEVHAYLHRLLAIDVNESRAGLSIPRLGSFGLLQQQLAGSRPVTTGLAQAPLGLPRAPSPTPRTAVLGPAGLAQLPPRAANLLPSAGGAGAAATAAPTPAFLPSTAGTPQPRRLGTKFVAIPIAPPGKVAGPLTPAEVQAIQAVVSLTDGQKLAWAVQGIMHHVFMQHGHANGAAPTPAVAPSAAAAAAAEAAFGSGAVGGACMDGGAGAGGGADAGCNGADAGGGSVGAGDSGDALIEGPSHAAAEGVTSNGDMALLAFSV